MLVVILSATAVSSNATAIKKKESLLFQIRTQTAIRDNNQTLKEKMNNIVFNFLKARIFI